MAPRNVKRRGQRRTPLPLPAGGKFDAHVDRMLDDALAETFPASDPVSTLVPDDVARRVAVKSRNESSV